MSNEGTVVVTGGAGYVGAVLVPKLLARGHRVRVLDLFLFGDDVLPTGNGVSLEDEMIKVADNQMDFQAAAAPITAPAKARIRMVLKS